MTNRVLLISVTLLLVLRMVIAVVHGQSHDLLAVPLEPWQNAFVWLVIVIAPCLTTVLLWFIPRAAVAWCLAGFLTAGWLFGLYFHFGPPNPDHVASVPHLPGHDLFAITAMGLAIVEPVVAAAAAWLAWSIGRGRERQYV